MHLAVDTGGLPHAIKVTSAEVTDREGAVYMLRRCALTRSEVVQGLCDGGYSGEHCASAVRMLLEAEVEAVKRNEPQRRLAASVCGVAQAVGG